MDYHFTHLPRKQLTGRILVFDVETTGLPPTRKPITGGCDVSEWPHITQISALLYDTNTSAILRHMNYYIKLPTGVVIPEIVTEITGIDNALCNEFGCPVKDVLQTFYELYSQCSGIVAHNYDFDRSMLQVEMLRCQSTLPYYCSRMFFEEGDRVIPSVCTMQDNVMKCKIWAVNPQNQSRYIKFPKLSEVYQIIFGQNPAIYGLHNSMVDTLVCLRVFLFTEYDIIIPEQTFASILQQYAQPLLRYEHAVATRTRGMSKREFVPITV